MGDIKQLTPDCALVLSLFRYYKDHPRKGQIFMDILPIFANSDASEIVVSNLATHLFNTYGPSTVGAVICPEAEGFLLGPLIASRLRVPCLVARKRKKLPGDVVRQGYTKWAGDDEFEMQKDAFHGLDMGNKGVVIVDDCVGSGGSTGAVMRLCRRLGVEVLEGCYIFETTLKAQEESQRKNLEELPVYGMIQIDEEALERMAQRDGKKDEEGEYSGDASAP